MADETMKPAVVITRLNRAEEFYSLGQLVEVANKSRSKALDEAAAIARANTSAPRIWKDGAWFNPHGDDIAAKIEALKTEAGNG